MGKSEKVQKNCGKLRKIVDLNPPPPRKTQGPRMVPTPREAGVLDSHPACQPASQPPKQYTKHKHWTEFQKF